MFTIDDKRRIVSLAAEVGTAVLRLRITQDIRQEDLAKRAKISRSYLSNIENGKVDVTVKALHSIATELGRTLAELLEDVG
jgi:transcriptional regulator with XRE-family HTH domain